jgi:hypothetical protein
MDSYIGVGKSAGWEIAKMAANYYTQGWASKGLETMAEGLGDEVMDLTADFMEAIKNGDPATLNPLLSSRLSTNCPQTKYYFSKQGWIKLVGVPLTFMGKLGGVFGWNVVELAQNSTHAANAAKELVQLAELAKKLPKKSMLRPLLDHVIKVKQFKLTLRGSGLGASCIPGIGGQVLGAVANVAKTNVVAYWNVATTAAAQGLHKSAYDGSKHALAIIEQLFNDYTPVGWCMSESKGVIQAMVKEGQGWLVFADKLNNI